MVPEVNKGAFLLPYFKGYYFKHQKDGETVAFIPGISEQGAFIQVLTPGKSECFHFTDITFGKTIRIGNNTFSTKGVRISLPCISGCIRYGRLTPLRSDIMGIFRFFPMECRHVIISMRHTLSGSLIIHGKKFDYDKGIGYIEGDSGHSFPKKYIWIQANDLPQEGSLSLSIAAIPFCGFHFRGVIAVLMLQGREYRFATYLGARIMIQNKKILLRQGFYTLTVQLLSRGNGYPLAAPSQGRMSGIVREDNHACICIRLWEKSRLLCHLTSNHAGYEHFLYNENLS